VTPLPSNILSTPAAHQLQCELQQSFNTLDLDWGVEVFQSIDSTSSELMRQAKLGLLAPKVVIALEQSQGRGRRGRAWISNAKDSLTLSMGLMLDPVNWLGLSLCVGIDLIQCLDPERKLGLMLKWPNDVWSLREGQYRKVAGILIETVSPSPTLGSSPTSSRYCILGMGVNLHTPQLHTDLPNPQPIGLSSLGGEVSSVDIVKHLAKLLPVSLRRFEREGFAPFKSQFDALNCLQGLDVFLSDGSTGTCQGVNDQGELLLKKNGIVHAHHSMEVSVRPFANNTA